MSEPITKIKKGMYIVSKTKERHFRLVVKSRGDYWRCDQINSKLTHKIQEKDMRKYYNKIPKEDVPL